MKIPISISVLLFLFDLSVYAYNHSIIKATIDFLLTSEYTHREKRAVLKAIQGYHKKERYGITESYIQENREVYQKILLLKKINHYILLGNLVFFILAIFNIVYFNPFSVFATLILTIIIRVFKSKNTAKIQAKKKPKKKKVIIVNKKVVVMSYIERYVPIAIILIVLMFSVEIAYILMAIYGIYEIIASHNHFEYFLCAMQNTCHKKMTPYKHSQSEINYLCKQGRQLGIVLLCMGTIGCIVMLIISR